MKKILLILLFASTNIFCNEDNEQKALFNEFKKNIISDYHNHCISTDNIKVIQISNIDDNLKIVLLESDGYFCSYIIYLDNYVKLFKNNLFYKCRFDLAKKYFPALEFSQYIDSVDNT